MRKSRLHASSPSLQAQRAAAACLRRLGEPALNARCQSASPLEAMRAIADRLEQEAPDGNLAWVVRTAGRATDSSLQPGNVSAWPLWFGDQRAGSERPLLYMAHSGSLAGLHAALSETKGHGIFCNHMEALRSRWPRGMHPSVPLWLSSDADGTPYDPASGAEALAIFRSALQALYVDGRPGFFYLSAHGDDSDDTPALTGSNAKSAFKGMYRISRVRGVPAASIRLLGAGNALQHVRHAAALLRNDWGIGCEVWSCPSYTRLARDGREADRWNMLHPLSKKRTSHLQSCLSSSRAPVVAVTGYARHVASQIGAMVPSAFTALGADSHPQQGQLSPQWIAAVALKLLGDAGDISKRLAGEALERYALTALS